MLYVNFLCYKKLNHGLVLRVIHRVIKFIKNVWLEPYIDMNKDLRT